MLYEAYNNVFLPGSMEFCHILTVHMCVCTLGQTVHLVLDFLLGWIQTRQRQGPLSATTRLLNNAPVITKRLELI